MYGNCKHTGELTTPFPRRRIKSAEKKNIKPIPEKPFTIVVMDVL